MRYRDILEHDDLTHEIFTHHGLEPQTPGASYSRKNYTGVVRDKDGLHDALVGSGGWRVEMEDGDGTSTRYSKGRKYMDVNHHGDLSSVDMDPL